MRRWRARTALVCSVLCRAVRDLQVPTSAAGAAVVTATRAPGHMPRDPTRCRPRYRHGRVQALRCGRERSRSSRVWVPRSAEFVQSIHSRTNSMARLEEGPGQVSDSRSQSGGSASASEGAQSATEN